MSNSSAAYENIPVDATAGARNRVLLAEPGARVWVVNVRAQVGAGQLYLYAGRSSHPIAVRQGNRLRAEHNPIRSGIYADVPAGVVAEFLVVYQADDGDESRAAFDVIDT